MKLRDIVYKIITPIIILIIVLLVIRDIIG